MAPAWGGPVRAPWQLVVRKGRLQGLLTVQALGPGIRNAKPYLNPLVALGDPTAPYLLLGLFMFADRVMVLRLMMVMRGRMMVSSLWASSLCSLAASASGNGTGL